MRVLGLVLLAACTPESKVQRVHEAPVAVVTAPENGAIYRLGEGDVVLIGEGTDSYDRGASLTGVWEVDGSGPVSGPLDADGISTLTLTDLDLGEHEVRFTVLDGDGDSAVDQVTFVMAGPLGAPSVTITEPEDGASYALGDLVAFRGEATDITTPAEELSFTWWSELQGELADALSGDGASACFTDVLVAGDHVVHLSATDADGEVGEDTVTVTIVDEPVIAEAGDLVFSEMMIQPQVAEDVVGEWVELFNTSGSTIDITGYTFRDEDVDAWVLEGPLVVAPHDYVVLCASLDTAVNGGVPCDGSFVRDSSGYGMALANGEDEVVLSRPDGLDIDVLHYDDTWIEPGVAIGVDPTWQESGANDDRDHWCLQRTVVSTGGEPGTPGQANDACDEV